MTSTALHRVHHSNGHIGVQISNNQFGGNGVQAHPGRGPGAPTPSVTLWVGANSMWSVWPAKNGTELGPNRTASRAAFGGITIGLAGLVPGGTATFAAEQRIGAYEHTFIYIVYKSVTLQPFNIIPSCVRCRYSCKAIVQLRAARSIPMVVEMHVRARDLLNLHVALECTKGTGELVTTHTFGGTASAANNTRGRGGSGSGGGVFTTKTVVHPTKDLFTISCSWSPTSEGTLKVLLKLCSE